MSSTTDLLASLEPLAAQSPPAGPPPRRPSPQPGGWWREAEEKLNQDPGPLRDQRKRIVISADGTWNTPVATENGKPAPTNVWLLHQLIGARAGDGLPQLAYYHPGVGTGGFLDRILGGFCGIGLERNILDCYRFLVENYNPGDAIYFFGFSRGAYTVRSLSGLVRNSGIIDRRRFAGSALDGAIARAYRLYRKRGDATAPAAQAAVDFRARHSHPDSRITCIGVWDTVGALGIPIGLLGRLSQHIFGFHDVTLSSRVDCAFQGIAVDERRRPFTPTLWEQQPGAKAAGQTMEQIWFAGVHSDASGGYTSAERDAANLTLRWMVNRVTQYCRLEVDTGALAAAPPSGVILHDSYGWYYWLLGGHLMRVIDGGLGRYGTRDPFRQTVERVHESVDLLRRTFGATPIPALGTPYAPPNVADYERRIAVERSAAAIPAVMASDLRESPGPVNIAGHARFEPARSRGLTQPATAGTPRPAPR